MRKWALFALKFAVSAALLYFAIRRIQIDTIGERLNQLAPGWLILAIAIGLLQTGLGAVRWQRIASLCGAAMPQSQAIRFGMIAAFFNQVLPSTVGGDAARIVLAARAGNGWRKATYSVLLDRFIGLLVLAMIVTAGLYWSFGLIANPIGRLVLLAVGLGSLAAAAAFLALGSLPLLQRWRPDAAPRRTGGARPQSPVLAHVRACGAVSVAADPPDDGSGRVERGARGRGPIELSRRAAAGAAGDADRHHSDLDRRLGRPRKRAGAGVLLCRTARKRRPARYRS